METRVRMWMVSTHLMCNQHLLAEHGEIHKFRSSFVRKVDMTLRVRLGQIEPASMKERHDQLVEEMLLRGMNHKSPYELPDLSYLSPEILEARVNPGKSMWDLIDRCDLCMARILKGTRARR